MGLDFTISQQARRSHPAETGSSSYGLIVHLLLLSTPPHDDAVTVGYRPEKVYLERTCTSLIKYAHRRTGPDATASGWRSHKRIFLAIIVRTVCYKDPSDVGRNLLFLRNTDV
jgi:hypothetical protein